MKDRHERLETWEDFENLMHKLDGVSYDVGIAGYFRKFDFTGYINNEPVQMTLEWYINICYVYMGDTQLQFRYCSIDGCWPNRCGRNLNLSWDNENTSAVIALQNSYGKEKANEA
jgi:hypothetical protein